MHPAITLLPKDNAGQSPQAREGKHPQIPTTFKITLGYQQSPSHHITDIVPLKQLTWIKECN